MDPIKTVGSLGAGAVLGRETALWFVNGIGKLPEHTVFGPLTDGARLELATALAGGLALLATWAHDRFTKRRRRAAAPPAAPTTEVPPP